MSRYYDFKNRHRTCKHVVPDYYQDYGDKYIRRFMNKLYPKLSRSGQDWLVRARYLLQKYMEEGFKQNTYKNKIYIPCKTMETLDIEFAPDFFVEMYTQNYHIKAQTDGINSLELNNEVFRSFAYATHPAAYIDAKVEMLPIEDIYHLGTTPDWGDMLTLDGITQVSLIFAYLMYDSPKRLGRTIDDNIELLKQEIDQLFYQFWDDIIKQGKQALFNELRDLINPIKFR